jgi:hypothetical protein
METGRRASRSASITPDPRCAGQHRDDNRRATSTCSPTNPEGFYLSHCTLQNGEEAEFACACGCFGSEY